MKFIWIVVALLAALTAAIESWIQKFTPRGKKHMVKGIQIILTGLLQLENEISRFGRSRKSQSRWTVAKGI